MSIPLVGSAIYGWPLKLASELLVQAITEWVGGKKAVPCLQQVTLIDVKLESVQTIVKAVKV